MSVSLLLICFPVLILQQVQLAASQGRPMPPGSKLTTSDGLVGIVKPNNQVQFQVPHNYQHRLLMQHCKFYFQFTFILK